MKIRLVVLLLSLFLLNGCYATFGDNSLSPAQVLEMQEREERIIKDQFQKKLEDIEGIWVQKTKNEKIKQVKSKIKTNTLEKKQNDLRLWFKLELGVAGD